MNNFRQNQARSVIKKIRLEIKKYFKQNQKSYAVFGKSKGLDSSVIAGLLSSIKSIKPIGVIMPIESSPDDEKIASQVLKHFKIPQLKIDLTDEYLRLKKKFSQEQGLSGQLLSLVKTRYKQDLKDYFQSREKYAYGNIKARLRMITLYHVAQLTGGIVVATGNYSEWWSGFWTLHGDVGDYYPIAELFKGKELYLIGKELEVPQESLEAVPSDGLGITKKGTDEEQLSLPYEQLDEVIKLYLKKKPAKKIEKITKLPELKVSKVISKIKETDFKRRLPVKIKRKALGLKIHE